MRSFVGWNLTQTKWLAGIDEQLAPPPDDGARERLRAIVSFFETRCDKCVEHYCPECTERLSKLIIEAAEFLAEGEHN